MTGKKHDTGKPRFDLIPPRAELEIARTLAVGGEKYGDENWRLVDHLRKRYEAALKRHVNAWKRGEQWDFQDGTHHLANAACCILFLLEAELEGIEG